jgi:hypothetical protein
MFKIQLMYPKLKINVYFIFLNIGDLTFGITVVTVSILQCRNGTASHPSASGNQLLLGPTIALGSLLWLSAAPYS